MYLQPFPRNPCADELRQFNLIRPEHHKYGPIFPKLKQMMRRSVVVIFKLFSTSRAEIRVYTITATEFHVINAEFAIYCPACRTTLIATRFRVAVICPIIQVPHCIRVFFYFVWFVFINHIFQFYNELCTYCNILDIACFLLWLSPACKLIGPSRMYTPWEIWLKC